LSHFTTLKTKLRDGDLVEQALKELGHKFTRKGERIQGWMGRMTTAEFRIVTAAASYDVGLVMGKDGYEVIADWYGVRGIDQKQFVRDLTRTYSTIATKKSLAAQGFACVSEETAKDGKVTLVLRKEVFG
jgi:hypothetical protein